VRKLPLIKAIKATVALFTDDPAFAHECPPPGSGRSGLQRSGEKDVCLL
jgi:hypothetical protein